MKKNSIINWLAFSFLMIFVYLLGNFQFGYAQQDDIKKRFFKEVDELMEQAKTAQAELLSPSAFGKVNKNYQDLVKKFDRGRIDQEKKSELMKWLELSIKNANRAKVVFSHLLVARDDALVANALDYSKDIFQRAEDLFINASITLEKGRDNKAKEKSINAEKLFREAELIAIKESIIGSVKLRINQALDEDVHKYASISIKRSQTLLKEAEMTLNSDRGAKSEAREKAETAGYEVQHATYLAEIIKKLKKDDANWEKVILQNEKYLARIISQLGFNPEFDTGFEKPVNSAITALKTLKQEKQQLMSEISALNQKNSSVESELAKLNSELDKSKEKEAGLKAKLLLEKKKKDKFKKIESIFNKHQAKVFREGEQIKIRLLGLKFRSGKAIINPDYFGLLTKLQQAIRIFPDYHVTIEGHTDNKGNDRMNQILSLSRSKAVMTYLMANMGLLEEQISAIGYGESRPIASNEIASGLAQNRRIDIVLSPNH